MALAPLEKIPAHVLDIIVDQCHGDHQAAKLALTSTTMLGKIGFRIFATLPTYRSTHDLVYLRIGKRYAPGDYVRYQSIRNNEKMRWLLFKLLETRCGPLHVLCWWCAKPHVLINPNDGQNDNEELTCVNWHSELMLPPRVQFATVRALMRRPELTEGLLAYIRTAKMEKLVSAHHVKLLTITDARVCQNSLFVKTEKVVLVGKNNISMSDLANLATLFFTQTKYRDSDLCPHRLWKNAYPLLKLNTQLRQLKYLSDIFPNRHRHAVLPEADVKAKVSKELYCMIYHRQPCLFKCVPILNKLQGCMKCHTDFCISTVDLASEGGRAIVFTTWKNLGDLGGCVAVGPLLDIWHQYWYHDAALVKHRQLLEVSTLLTPTLRGSSGAYEGRPNSLVYLPQIAPEHAAKLT